VAEELLNPFGEDDDNFEINSLIDSLLKVLPLCASLPMSVYLSVLPSGYVSVDACVGATNPDRYIQLIVIFSSVFYNSRTYTLCEVQMSVQTVHPCLST